MSEVCGACAMTEKMKLVDIPVNLVMDGCRY